MKPPIMRNPYEVLELSKDATEEDIKRQYRKLALKYHPDRIVNATADEQAESKKQFQEINRANTILSDPIKRKIFDEQGENGLRLMEQFGEEFYTRVYMRINKPWVKALVCFIGMFTCGFCFCFGCCFCCCCFCFGKCRPKTEDEDESEFRETSSTVEEKMEDSATSSNVIVNQLPVVEKVDETSDNAQYESDKPHLPTIYGAI